MMLLVEFVAEMGFNTMVHKFKNKMSDKELKERIQLYVDRQEKIHEISTYQQEIDFQGLMDYIQGSMMVDIQTRLFGNREERRVARENISNKALAYSQADTIEAKKYVKKVLCTTCDILREFYLARNDPSVRALVAAASEDLEAIITEESNNTRKASKENHLKTQGGIADVKNAIENLDNQHQLSTDKNIQLAKQGRLGDIESSLTDFSHCIGTQHVLYPHYGYTVAHSPNGIRFLSCPLSDEAIKRYPPQIECNANVYVGDVKQATLSNETINYANRHQLPIKLSIVDAKKMLGDTLDPAQYEAEKMIGKDLVILPQPFSQQVPCKIAIDSVVQYDYIVLKTIEILDDGTIVISNEAQVSRPINITLNVHLKIRLIDISVSIHENSSNTQVLQFLLFLKHLSNSTFFEVIDLTTSGTLMKGRSDPYVYHSPFKTVDEEISFLQNLIDIETYFNTEITIPHEVYEEDIKKLEYLSTLVKHEDVISSWKRLELSQMITAEFKNFLSSIKPEIYHLEITTTEQISLFGNVFELLIVRHYADAIIEDLERLKSKAEILDIGDTTRIILLAANPNASSNRKDRLAENDELDFEPVEDTLN